MKKNLFILLLILFMIPLFSAQKLKRLGRNYTIQYNRMYNQLSPAGKSHVARAVKQFESRMIPLIQKSDPKGILNGVIGAAGLGNLDKDQAAAMVMFKAVKDIDDDILRIMAEVKAMTAAKQKLRDFIKELNQWISKQVASHASSEDINNQPVSPSDTGHKSRMFKARKLFTPKYKVPYYQAPLVKRIPNVKRLSVKHLRQLLKDNTRNLKRVGELLEEISLKLKLLMDRRAKFIRTLAGLMKRITTTQNQLTENIK